MILQQSPIFCKIVIVGQSGVGKTNILSRYIHDRFFVATTPTIGVELSTKIIQIHNKVMKYVIWDTCGQQKFRALSSIFYKGAVGACIVFDVGQKTTFNNIGKWLKQLASRTPNGIVKLLIGNKCDLYNREVSTQQALKFAKQQKIPYIQTSAAKGINIVEAFDILFDDVYYFVQQLNSSERMNQSLRVSDLSSQNIFEKKCCEK